MLNQHTTYPTSGHPDHLRKYPATQSFPYRVRNGEPMRTAPANSNTEAIKIACLRVTGCFLQR